MGRPTTCGKIIGVKLEVDGNEVRLLSRSHSSVEPTFPVSFV